MSIGGEFNRDRFIGLIGTPFSMTTAEGKNVVIELAEVSDLRLLPNQASYSLRFRFPEGYPVQQGIHDLRHSSLGKLQLFLVPVITPGNKVMLEAVFNFVLPNSSTSG